MIQELEIHNFKSIKDLTLPCKRFNIFIGEPNTGKSNILEALGLLSFIGVRQYVLDSSLDGFVRHEQTSQLFFDEEIGDAIRVRADSLSIEFVSHEGEFQGQVVGHYDNVLSDTPGTISSIRIARLAGTYSTKMGVRYLTVVPVLFLHPTEFKFYRFDGREQFGLTQQEFLLPPSGENLPSLLLQNRELRTIVNQPFISAGLRLGLRPQENKVELIKQADDVIISYPYSLASDTLKRITFYTAAIETNKNSVIVLEEPEAHSFPGETKLLAEQIAMDENSNQYFIVTHNPYFLMPLLSKAPKDDIAINIVYNDDYQTKVRPLEAEELPELFELDIFANLSRYIED